MNCARARTSRGIYGVNGLQCLSCSGLFTKASDFARHECFKQIEAQAELARLANIKPEPAKFQTLTGEQLELKP